MALARRYSNRLPGGIDRVGQQFPDPVHFFRSAPDKDEWYVARSFVHAQAHRHVASLRWDAAQIHDHGIGRVGPQCAQIGWVQRRVLDVVARRL